METVTARPAVRIAPASGLRRAAMTFFATGRTAEGLRAHAADPLIVEGVARISGDSEENVRNYMVAIAVAVDVIAAEGLTPEECYDELGLAEILGPREGKGGDPE